PSSNPENCGFICSTLSSRNTKLVETALAEWNRDGPILLVPNQCPGNMLSRNGCSRSLAGNWSSLAMLSFAPVTGAPRMENGNALLVDLAERRRNFRNVHIRPNAP